MFKEKHISKEDNAHSNHDTIIGPSIKIEGDFQGDGDVYVEGEVQGSIKTNKTLHVGPEAKIKADIEVKDAIVSGKITGNLKLENKLEVKNTAQIQGDIETKLIVVEEGAKISGQIKMNEVSPEEKGMEAAVKKSNNKIDKNLHLNKIAE